MSPVILSILLQAAARVGAPFVKSVLEQHVGGAAGELGGEIVDAIAAKVGVPADEIVTAPPEVIDKAVAQVESESPELVLAYNARQAEANRLMLAEMNKDTAFGWMWRPAGMWLMLVCIGWYIVVVPLLNAALSAVAGRQEAIGLVVDFASFVPVFVTFCGLYMGGNTLIRAVRKDG